MSYVGGRPRAMSQSIDSMRDSGIAPLTVWTSQGAWPTANLAIYVPLLVASRVIVRKFWYGSGATGTGNIDMGLYDAAGVAVITIDTAAKPASASDIVIDVTDTTIGPGLYYLGLSSDTNTDTFARRDQAGPMPAAWGVLTEASAYPLPATATMVVDNALAFMPAVGLLVEGTAT